MKKYNRIGKHSFKQDTVTEYCDGVKAKVILNLTNLENSST